MVVTRWWFRTKYLLGQVEGYLTNELSIGHPFPINYGVIIWKIIGELVVWNLEYVF